MMLGIHLVKLDFADLTPKGSRKHRRSLYFMKDLIKGS